jgi:hypothetical protein
MFILEMGVLIFFLLINFITPLMGEDYALLPFSPSENIHFGIVMFQKMISRIQSQMLGWNVRVGEQLSIMFGCFDKVVFDICNSLISLYFIFLVELYAFKDKRSLTKKIITTYIVFLLLVSIQPVLGEIFFWRTGSTNYLWAICLLLTFILPLRYYVGSNRVDIIDGSRIKMCILIVMGFFAGFTNENTVGTFWILYISVMVYNKMKKISTPLWVYLSFVSYTLGFVFMLKAPSTAYRIAYYNRVYGITELSIADYIERTRNIIKSFFSTNYRYVIIMILSFVLSMFWNEKRHILNRIEHSENVFLLLLSSVSCGALIFSPYIETRSFLLADFMMLVCIVYYVNFLIEQISVKKYIYSILLIITAVPLLFSMTKIYKVYREYNNFCELRESAAVLSNEEFFWGYYGVQTSRILTTRENYLMGNEYYLDNYFNKDITVVKGSVWDLGIERYEEHPTIGNIDSVSADEDTSKIFLEGWVAFVDHEDDIDDYDIYVAVNRGSSSIYYYAEECERKDIANALDSNQYFNTGFYMDYFEDELNEVTIYIVDRKCMIYGKVISNL